ncbi:glycosyltransferase family 1 protein, partial [Acidianus sp. DSM 29099]|nr:glycosyltransferase family 1 protein [Acidianus sp. RZ1]
MKRRFQVYTLFKVPKIFRSPYIKVITTVSKGEGEVWKVPKEKLRVLYPSNAFNAELLKYRTINNKEDYLVFWARLTFKKGLFDI